MTPQQKQSEKALGRLLNEKTTMTQEEVVVAEEEEATFAGAGTLIFTSVPVDGVWA